MQAHPGKSGAFKDVCKRKIFFFVAFADLSTFCGGRHGDHPEDSGTDSFGDDLDDATFAGSNSAVATVASKTPVVFQCTNALGSSFFTGGS